VALLEIWLKSYRPEELFDAQGRLVKRRFPGATMLAFKLLAKLRFLRGTVFDVFGRTQERREERQLVTDYEHSLMQVLPVLTPDNRELVLALARCGMRYAESSVNFLRFVRFALQTSLVAKG
jgi:indolepyruvate ferredoxin oxidoreductase